MKFRDLVNMLNEAKSERDVKNSSQYVASGPKGFPKNLGLGDNPEKVLPKDERGWFDKNDPKTKGKKGRYIVQDNMRYIKTAMLVAMTDVTEGIKLRDLIKGFMELYHEYISANRDVRRIDEIIMKMNASGMRNYNKERPYGKDAEFHDPGKTQQVEPGYGNQTHVPGIVQLMKQRDDQELRAAKYLKLSNEYAEKNLPSLHGILKQGAANFVSSLKQTQGDQVFKSFEDLDIVPEEDPAASATKAYLMDITSGNINFGPLNKFINTEMEVRKKNPFIYLTNIYKDVANTAVEKHLVGNPNAVFNHVAGMYGKISTVAKTDVTKPWAGRSKVSAAVNKVIILIKKRQYRDAKNAVVDTELDNTAKADLMMQIDKLENGQMSEGEIVRSLFNKPAATSID